MAHSVCPWWLGYALLFPLRRFRQDPHTILQPVVTEGMVVLEPGPGMGYFTLELARLVGARGRVVAVDVQPKMLAALGRRARRAGLESRIELRQAKADAMGIADLAGTVDFVLAFAVVHELPDAAGFFAEALRALKPAGRLLISEPTGHVSREAFDASLALAESAGLSIEARPEISGGHSALLRRR